MNPHILFVDDEAPIRELLSVCFRMHGLRVTIAMTGKEARVSAATAVFDLAILDLDLPDDNGLDLLRLFKRQSPKMPVIIFTGLGGDERLAAQARDSGAAAFMDKSESLYVLLDQVRAQLPGHPPLSLPRTAVPNPVSQGANH